MELYESITDMVWDYHIFKSMSRHYEKYFRCSKVVAEDFVLNHHRETMRKYYEKQYLPEINSELEYAK